MNGVQPLAPAPEPAIVRAGMVAQRTRTTFRQQMGDDARQRTSTSSMDEVASGSMSTMRRNVTTNSAQVESRRPSTSTPPLPLSNAAVEFAEGEREQDGVIVTAMEPVARVAGPSAPTAEPVLPARKRTRSHSKSRSLERKRTARHMGDAQSSSASIPPVPSLGPDALGPYSPLPYPIPKSPTTLPASRGSYADPAPCTEPLARCTSLAMAASTRNATRTPPPTRRQQLRARSRSPAPHTPLSQTPPLPSRTNTPAAVSRTSTPGLGRSSATGTLAGDRRTVRQAMRQSLVVQIGRHRGNDEDQTSDEDTVLIDSAILSGRTTPLWGSPMTPNTPGTLPTTPGSWTRSNTPGSGTRSNTPGNEARSNTPGRVRPPTPGRTAGPQTPSRGAYSVPGTSPQAKGGSRRSERQTTCRVPVVDDREDSQLPPRHEEAGGSDGATSELEWQRRPREEEKTPQKPAVSTPIRLQTHWSPVIEEEDDDELLTVTASSFPTLPQPTSTTPQSHFPRASEQTGALLAFTSERAVTSPVKFNVPRIIITQHYDDGGNHPAEAVEDHGPDDEQSQVVYPEDPSAKVWKAPHRSLKCSGPESDPSFGCRKQPDHTKHIEPDDVDGDDCEVGSFPKFPPPQSAPSSSCTSRPSTEDAPPPQVKSSPSRPPTPSTPIVSSSAQQNSRESNPLFAWLHCLPTGVPPVSGYSSGQHPQTALQSHPQSSMYLAQVTGNGVYPPRQGKENRLGWQPEKRTKIPASRPSVGTPRGGRLRLNGLVPGRSEDVANRERAISVASGKMVTAHPQRSHQTAHAGLLDTSLASNGWDAPSPVSPRFPVDPGLANGKVYTSPEIQELEAERERQLLESYQPTSGNPAERQERYPAAVVNTYPLVNQYASDIGSYINLRTLDTRPFAGGAFGSVRRARLRDGRRVAIKCLRSGTRQLEKKLLKEIRVWSFLEHKNVLPLLGLCVVDDELGMVSEFMPNGNIQEYIQRNPGVDRYWLAINVCAGLAYLHEHPKHVVHGDLKAVNVVVDTNGIPKLTDFGLAKTIRAEDSTEISSSSSIGGTSRWMAYELIISDPPNAPCSKPNSASDVYSLGMTIYEMFSGTLPFASRKNDFQVIAAIMREELPERVPNLFPDGLWELLLRCWRKDPSERPTAREVMTTLEGLRNGSRGSA